MDTTGGLHEPRIMSKFFVLLRRKPRAGTLRRWWRIGLPLVLFGLTAALVTVADRQLAAQVNGPAMLDPALTVNTVISGLNQPTSMAFLGPRDFLVLEKPTGRVIRVVNGAIHSIPIDLPVNSASERGLLGIALHPRFPAVPFVYLYWTQSSTGQDSDQLADVPLRGNRVDRFLWHRATSTLTLDRNLITLHSFQADAGQTLRGNHNAGVLRFGHDRKLYIVIGDNGRRGMMQNLPNGPFGPGQPDDQFGGPFPDNNHLTGVIIRLDDDGSIPRDNPFFKLGAALGGEVGTNIQKIFAYGVRNTFGMAFDPVTGLLWSEENGDDSFDEINQVRAGSDNGWIQIMGPVSRVSQFKQIEVTFPPGTLQQLRWPPTNIADTPQEALSRLFLLPGAHYNDPQFAWKWAVAPAGIGFMSGPGMGPNYRDDLFVGAARTFLADGYLFRFKLSRDRQHLALADPRLADGVADNHAKFDITESESLLVGHGFGIGTDIETGRDGNLYVVSLSNGAVYQITRRRPGR